MQKGLSEAIQAEDAAAVKAVIAAGADVNEPYKHSMGTNHSLQMAVRYPPILHILLENGADPNGVDTPNNSNALAYAVFNGQAESAAALLAAGTDPNHVDLMGFTPLAKESYAWLPPATEEEIAELAAFVGAPLPPALLDIYRRANGQKPNARKPLCPPADSLDGGWFLSPISEVIADSKMLTELLDNGEFAGQKKKVLPDAEVQKEWWDRHWLPILADGGGDHVCVDFNRVQFVSIQPHAARVNLHFKG